MPRDKSPCTLWELFKGSEGIKYSLYTSPTNCLIFFERLDELEPLTAANIRIRVLQRSQYDPMDVLV
jgi:hypothetical protein